MRTKKFTMFALAMATGLLFTLGSCNKENTLNNEVKSSDGALKASGPSANGQGTLSVPYLEGFSTFSFHARQKADGSVSGSWSSNWQSSNPGLGGQFSGIIDCMEILPDGITARMTGIVTHVNGDCCPVFGFTPEVGGLIAFIVQDNGEGQNSSGDLFSDWGYFGDNETTCSVDWGFALYPIDNGNIQVKP